MVSNDAQRVLDLLPESLQPMTYATVRETLGMDRDTFDKIKLELLEASLVRVLRGRGGLIARVGSVDQRILAYLPSDGELVTNSSIITALELTDDEFYAARESLLERELVRLGRGRGGKTGLVQAGTARSVEPEAAVVGGVESEEELYQVVKDHFDQLWKSDFEPSPPNYYFSVITGQRRSSTGKWSIPDVCILTMSTYDYLPGKFLELTTIEVKRHDYIDISAVFETASHSKYGHKSYLVFEWLEENDFDKSGEAAIRIIREAERFGIGLIQMKPAGDGKWRFQYIVEPTRNDPDPVECNDFIKERFNEGTILAKIRGAVGR